MFKEIKNKLNAIKQELKKEDDYEKLITLRKERLELEAELLKLKKEYITHNEQANKIKIRKLNDHFKFLLGGIILRDNPDILKKYHTKEELEKLSFKIIDLKTDNSDVNNTEEITEEIIKKYFSN